MEKERALDTTEAPVSVVARADSGEEASVGIGGRGLRRKDTTLRGEIKAETEEEVAAVGDVKDGSTEA